MSLIVPPPFEMLALPKSPARNRNPISMLMLVDRAHPICDNVKTVKQTVYIGFLPKVSLIGAKMRGPPPNPNKSTDTENAESI